MKLTESSLREHWISSVLVGENPGYSFTGTKEQLKALSEALMMTRLFEDEIASEVATVTSVMETLQRKHRAVQRFEKIFGKKSWPL